MSNNPTTGCSVIVQDGNRVLLIQRGKEPYKGHWSLPGGGHEIGETLEECARRELKEETNLEAATLTFCKVRDRITRDSDGNVTFHYVLATYLAEMFTGTPEAGDDAADLGWFSYHEMQDILTTPETPGFLKEVLGQSFVR